MTVDIHSGLAVCQIVVFDLDGSEYALPIESVREVLRMVAFAPVPESPDWLVGAVNLRGRALPLVDLRLRLGLPARPYGLSTPIVVVESGGRSAAVAVDRVLEALPVPADAFEPVEGMVGRGRAARALVRAGDRLVTLLDPDRLCPSQDAPRKDT